jgi:uncharacterized protein (TIGR03086 family)
MVFTLEPTLSLDRAMAAVIELVDGVRADQWGNPTPCSDWNVRRLVDHLVAGNLRFAALRDASPFISADGEPPDPATAYRFSAIALHAAFAEPGVLKGTYHSPMGQASGAVLMQLRITEQLVHGWDLAQATGRPHDLPEDLAEQALIISRAQLGDTQREGIPFEPAQCITEDASQIDKLAAFCGRRP